MQVLISKMEKSDIDEVCSIEELAYGEHHWSKESFLNEIDNNLTKYFVAKDINSKKVTGYLGSWFIIDECHITNVAVHPQFRKQKIAFQLIKNLIDKCYEEKIKYIMLEVRVSNTPAISLYEKFGFKSIGVRKNYYQDNNEDALIMFTENIWHEKFKTLYNNLTEKV